MPEAFLETLPQSAPDAHLPLLSEPFMARLLRLPRRLERVAAMGVALVDVLVRAVLVALLVALGEVGAWAVLVMAADDNVPVILGGGGYIDAVVVVALLLALRAYETTAAASKAGGELCAVRVS